MLYTNLKHIENASDQEKIISEHENIMICCGRMGLTCISVYGIMEQLQKRYRHVKFYDMEFDNPESLSMCESLDCKDLSGLPYLFYYKNGEPMQITSGMQTKEEIVAILDKLYGKIQS